MHTLRRLIKHLIAYTLYYSGALHLLCRIRLRNRAVVLTYHRVLRNKQLPLSNSSPGIIVNNVIFEKHLKFIKRHFRLLSIAQFQDCVSTHKSIPNRSCLLTFDDGWLDNYETAFPILRLNCVPAIVFLPFNYISSNQIFWQEELLMRLVHLLGTGRPSDRNFVKELVSLKHEPDRGQLREYVSRLKSRSNREIDSILQLVRDNSHDDLLPDHYNKYMSWEQVMEMQKNGIAFGSHTLSHRILTGMPDNECLGELRDSKTLIEDAIGVPVSTIAYPNGDHNEKVDQLAEQAGYTLGFTTRRGYVSSDTNVFSIPRINIHNNSSCNNAIFLCTILGIFQSR